MSDNQSFLRNLDGVLSEESKKVLKDCFTVVKNTQERLHNMGLHLLMEVPVLDTMHQLSDTNIEEDDQDFEATVVFSKTVDFTQRNHRGGQHIINGLSLFRMNKTRPANDDRPERAPTESLVISQGPPSNPIHCENQTRMETETIKTSIDNDYRSFCSRMSASLLFKWFPGKNIDCSNETVVIQNETNILKVNCPVYDILIMEKSSRVLKIYKRCFSELHDLIRQSDYKIALLRNGWRGKFHYSNFTPPWLKYYISIRDEVVQCNTLKVIGLPDAKSLRNALGHKRICMLLAAFYEQEEWIRPLLKKFAFEEGIRLACYQSLESAASTVEAVDIRRRNLIDALTTITAASALQASSQEPTVPALEAPLENSSPLPPDFMQEIDMGPLLPPDQSANNLMQSSEESNQHVENAMEGRPSQQAQQSPQTHPQASEPEPRRALPN